MNATLAGASPSDVYAYMSDMAAGLADLSRQVGDGGLERLFRLAALQASALAASPGRASPGGGSDRGGGINSRS